MTTQKNWTVAWKPIDKATAEPKYSDVNFESFMEADYVARSMNKTDPENHYFPTLCDDVIKPCAECGMLVKESGWLRPTIPTRPRRKELTND